MQLLHCTAGSSFCFQTFRNIGIGIGATTIEWIVRDAFNLIGSFFSRFHFNEPCINQDKQNEYSKFIDKHPLKNCILSPLMEEALYRGLILNSYKLLLQNLKTKTISLVIENVFANLLFISSYLISSKELREILGIIYVLIFIHLSDHQNSQSKLSLPANFLQSLLFGLAHFKNFHSFSQTIGSVFSGFIYGHLTERYGLISSISAHITNNLFVFLKRFLRQKKAALIDHA